MPFYDQYVGLKLIYIKPTIVLITHTFGIIMQECIDDNTRLSTLSKFYIEYLPA